MVVCPSITQCGPMLVPAPTLTWGPMSVYGPTVTELSSSAPGSTMAVAWIAVMRKPSRDGAHGASQFGFDSEFFTHQGTRLELENTGLHAQQFDLQNQLIAGLH